MARTVRGARVLIAGATSAMGLLYAERAVAEGARSVILWDADRRRLEDAVIRLTATAAEGTGVHGFPVALTELGAIAQTAQKVRKQVGDPEVLINNAGVVRGDRHFWQTDNGDDTRTTMQVNALAAMYVTREFLPAMIAHPHRAARIVNVTSAALASSRQTSVQAAAAWAMIGWSDSLRVELQQADHGNVKVTTVAPSRLWPGVVEGVRGAMLTPATPERFVDRVWRAMLAGKPTLILPGPAGSPE